MVSARRAPYTFTGSTGAATTSSRSSDRKNVESAVITLESKRIEKNVRNARPSSFPASRSPIPCVPLKYSNIRKITRNVNVQKKRPTNPSRNALNTRDSSVRALLSLERNFGLTSQSTPGRNVLARTRLSFRTPSGAQRPRQPSPHRVSP